MSSDTNDKTVFMQAGRSDRTSMRPNPGGRRPAPEPAGGPRPVEGMPQRSAATPSPAAMRPVTLGRGLNPLLASAATLLAVYQQTRHSASHRDVAGLHRSLVDGIRDFEQKGREQGVKSETLLAARYMLCSFLDEAVLNTPWGSESSWAQRTLLSAFHNETSGGEKCFLIIDRMRQSPVENLEFLEFSYVLLSLGFEGKYRIHPRGREAIDQIKDELFALVRRYRGEYERSLSPSWQGLGTTKRSLVEHVPLWVLASVFAAVLLVSFSGFRYLLYNSATPVVYQLETLVHPADQ
jgi:type VI secretion system protein ImpK